ncbi:MAG: 30S ribosomal protein S12 methylthiotransferase RimO [Lachnospiraceae bacterium]|nr:30S ribosomal protein S12 methylthiotransferase RimO [Lachnospiraceae bacterium]
MKTNKTSIMFISLGCDKNLVDTEEMLGILGANGYEFTNDESEADVIVINSCCFINDAKEESINTILEMAQYKTAGTLKALIVTGCLAERYRDEILKEIPEVDGIVGTSSYDTIADVIKSVLDGQVTESFLDLNRLPDIHSDRMVTTGGYYAHLKIAEGCDKHCTYCIIPKIRGKYRSVPMEKLVKQAEYLASIGVKELILVAQETTIYGVDLYGKKSLHILLEKLCEIRDIKMIRIMYCYPEEIYDELIDTIAREKKVCNYLDMPIQHCSDDILKRMGRRTTKSEIKATVNKLRARIPDIILRTTLIAGFPGETEEHHQEMMEFVDEMEFDRLGVFTYSPEEGTPAASMADQVDEEMKLDWRDDIMELQQEIAFDKSEAMIGKELLVMIEGKIAGEPAYVGRSYMDAPGIDGNIFINTGEEFISGDLAMVKIIGANEYDLIGEIL